MFPRDIQAELEELYGIDGSLSMISKITDKIIDTSIAWQNREFDPVYTIVYMNAIHFKVREESKIINKASYICMAIDIKGYKEILDIWVGKHNFPYEIRRIIYTTNALEGVNRQLRKFTKTKTMFPTDDSLRK